MKRGIYVRMIGLAALCMLGSSQSKGAENESLSIVYPGFSTTAVITYLADGKGYFKQVGLDMKILDGQGANSLTLVVSGQADIYGAGPIAAGLGTAAKGLPTLLFYAVTGGGQSGYTVGNPKTAPTLEALGKLKTCKINTFAAGTTPYAFALLLKQKYAPQCEIVPFSDVPSAIASMAGGHADAIVASFSSLNPAIMAKQAVTIIETRDPAVTQKVFGDSIIESSDWGLTSNLEKKRSAVVKYIRASKLAQDWLKANSDEEAAKVLQQYQGFRNQPLASLTEQVGAARSYLQQGSSEGRIDEKQWQQAIEFLNGAGMLPDPKNIENTYAKRVNSSFFDEAQKKN